MSSLVKLYIDEIKPALREADLKMRPKIIFMNPSDAEFIRTALPNIENEVVIQSTSIVEEGKMYIMNRRDLDILEVKE